MPNKRKSPGVTQLPNGRWKAVASLPRDEDGKYPQATRTFDTRREAEQWKLDTTDPRKRRPAQRGMTVAQLLADWLEYQEPRIAATTHRTYAQYVTNRINPHIGKIRADRLSVADVDHLYARLRRDDMQPASIRQVHAILRGALGWGRKRGYVDLNVAADADPPSLTKTKITPPTATQVKQLLATATAHDEWFGVAVRLAAATGARRGTIATLRLSDFAFADGSVMVDRSGSIVNGRRIVKGLKYEDTGGTVPVDVTTMSVAADWIASLHERAHACGFELADDFYLFAEDVACTIFVNPDALTKRWNTVRGRVPGCSRVRFHDLRHFVPTELLAAGFETSVITDRLKWASNAMLDVYGHAKSERATAAGDHIGRLLG